MVSKTLRTLRSQVHASKLDLSGGVKTVHLLEINELLVGVAKRDKTEINR